MNCYSVWWSLLILSCLSVCTSFLIVNEVTAENRKVVFLIVFVKTKQTLNLLV